MQLNSGPGNIIERTFQLASSGDCFTLADVKAKLKQEGFDQIDAHLSGLSIRREIHRRFSAAQSMVGDPHP